MSVYMSEYDALTASSLGVQITRLEPIPSVLSRWNGLAAYLERSAKEWRARQADRAYDSVTNT